VLQHVSSCELHVYLTWDFQSAEFLKSVVCCCADVVMHFKSAHNITFQSLSPFNEPASPAWCLMANCTQEACFFTRRRAQKVR
jgi:hypothetical protein